MRARKRGCHACAPCAVVNRGASAGEKRKRRLVSTKTLKLQKLLMRPKEKSVSSGIMASKTCGHTKPTAVRSQGMKPTKHPPSLVKGRVI